MRWSWPTREVPNRFAAWPRDRDDRYGNKRAATMRTSSQKPGVNVNVLMPTGIGTYEPLSYMSVLCGVPAHVQSLQRDPPTT